MLSIFWIARECALNKYIELLNVFVPNYPINADKHYDAEVTTHEH